MSHKQNDIINEARLENEEDNAIRYTFVKVSIEARIDEIKYLMSNSLSVGGERASFKPKNFDGLTSWPIVTEPVRIIPKRVLKDRLDELRKELKKYA